MIKMLINFYYKIVKKGICVIKVVILIDREAMGVLMVELGKGVWTLVP